MTALNKTADTAKQLVQGVVLSLLCVCCTSFDNKQLVRNLKPAPGGWLATKFDCFRSVVNIRIL